jgi:predicted NUDIX family NTP pyrophosphohydrolase
MGKVSAGLLAHRAGPTGTEVFLVHPGGPFWRNRDLGAWSIPKGEIEPGEDALAAARREFHEETGQRVEGDFIVLPECRQAGGKLVRAWMVEASPDPTKLTSNTVEIEWPPRSGRRQAFPEVDRAEWFPLAEARRRINKGQAALIDALVAVLAGQL